MNELNVTNFISELYSKNTSYNRKQYILELSTEECVKSIKNNFLLLGFLADYCINNGDVSFLHLKPHYVVDFIAYMREKFQVEKSTIYAAMNCYTQYCIRANEKGILLKPEYEQFNQSQLVEMLPLSYAQRKKIDSKMTIKQIREIKKELLPKKEKAATPQTVAKPDQMKLMPMPGIEKLADLKEEYSGRPENDLEQVDPIVIEASESVLSSKLVLLTNDKQRQEWLHNYEKWGVWLDVKPLQMKYYRYYFGNADGDHVIVMVQTVPVESYNKEGKKVIYSLVRPKGYPKVFQPGGNAQSMIVDYLREQKLAVMQF